MKFGGFHFQRSKEGIRSVQTSNGIPFTSFVAPPVALNDWQQKCQQLFKVQKTIVIPQRTEVKFVTLPDAVEEKEEVATEVKVDWMQADMERLCTVSQKNAYEIARLHKRLDDAGIR